MIFNSSEFVIFFLIVYGLYVGLSHPWQNRLLLVASLIFYGSWDWRFLILLMASAGIDFVAGIFIHDSPRPHIRRLLLLVSMAGNLGVLFTFKYFNFFAQSFAPLHLAIFGTSPDWTTLNVILPMGISFYTFQSMSYTIDVYRGELTPTRSVSKFFLFVAFFPQLVAGPIERAKTLIGQIDAPRFVNYQQVRQGLWLLLLGYYKKVVLADNLARFSSELFAAPGEAHGVAALLAIYAFAFQIYGDFSGYSDIARGLAKLMGFELMVNFANPYFATSPKDFWSRWHISFSTWLRDYLYIPLGGNRLGSFVTYRNLMLVMLLGGLWHGAAWHFVAWGLYHGLLLCLFRAFSSESESQADTWRPLRAALFFQLTCLGWVLFGVHSLGDVSAVLRGLLIDAPLNAFAIDCGATLFLFALPVMILEFLEESRGRRAVSEPGLTVKLLPGWMRLCVYSLFVAMVVLSGATKHQEFIYFQF